VTVIDGIEVEGFVVTARGGELRVEAFMPGDDDAVLVQKLRDAGVDPATCTAFEERRSVNLLKARHNLRGEDGRMRPAKPHEKLSLVSAWKHGGAVHPALLPKP
jgi:hypothetical protein